MKPEYVLQFSSISVAKEVTNALLAASYIVSFQPGENDGYAIEIYGKKERKSMNLADEIKKFIEKKDSDSINIKPKTPFDPFPYPSPKKKPDSPFGPNSYFLSWDDGKGFSLENLLDKDEE